MAVILELENPERWQTRDSQLFSTTPPNELAEYTSSENFTSNVIAVLVDTSEARETWKFGGWVSQKINAPIGPGSIPTKVNYKRLWLYEKQLLIFPAEITNYQVTVRFPKWFVNASITVWEYQNTAPF